MNIPKLIVYALLGLNALELGAIVTMALYIRMHGALLDNIMDGRARTLAFFRRAQETPASGFKPRYVLGEKRGDS